VTVSTTRQISSRTSMAYRKAVKPPSSIALAPTLVMWSPMRLVSAMIMRMYSQRSVARTPSSFSTAMQ
jgi:hypothetical protein